MTAQLHNQAMQIFMAAVELQADSRPTYVQQACGDDETLRAEVESLLTHHHQETVITPGTTLPTVARSKKSRLQTAKFTGFETRRFWRDPIVRVIALSLIPILASAWWGHANIKRSLRQSLETQLQTVLDADVAALENWIELHKTEAAGWAAKRDVRAITAILLSPPVEDTTDRDTAAQTLRELLAPVMQHRGFHSYGILARDGKIVASSVPKQLGAEVSEAGAPYLSQLNRGVTIFAIPTRERKYVAAIPSISGDPTVAFAAPILDEQQAPVASLCFGYDADDEFARILSIARLGETGETYAFNQAAVLLSKLRDRATLEASGLVGPGESAALNVQIRDPGGDLAAGFEPTQPLDSRPLTKMAAHAIAGYDDLDVEGYRNYRGADVIGAWRWLPDHGFGVGTEITAREAYRPLIYLDRAITVLVGTASLLLIAVALSTVLAYRFRRRIGLCERFGSYELDELIGRGGMGEVYRARHAFIKRLAAVKLVDPASADDEVIGRFEREVQLTCLLTHPNTIQIYDFGRSTSGMFYYAMEYLPGVTVERLISLEGTIGVVRTVHILLQVCGSLDEAHRLGMVHRDIKPGNLMLCQRGGIYDFVKVLDFGLAKPISGHDSQTVTRSPTVVAGTPHYVAPERILSPTLLDPRSDLFSLGVVAFLMLTGRPVFLETEVTRILHRTVVDDAPAPSSCGAPGIPPELDELITACLARDREQRPESAAEIADRLRAIARQYPWTQDEARGWWEQQQVAMAK